MSAASTLRELIAEHPEWADLPITVAAGAGEVDWLQGSASVYESVADDGKGNEVRVITFAPN